MSKRKFQPGSSHNRPGSQSVGGLLQQAVGAHQAGHVERALGLYGRVLALEPAHPDALNFAGMAHVQAGNPDKAVQLLQKATARHSDFAEAYQNLGVALKMLGRFEEALEAYRSLVQLKPDYAQGYNDLGIVLRQLGQNEEAKSAYARALTIAPDYAEAHANLGNLLRNLDQLDEAGESYRRSIAVKPGQAGVHRSLGLVLQLQGKLDEAIDSYRKAIRIQPDYAATHADLGRALVEKGMIKDGVSSLRESLQIDSKDPEVFTSLGIALHDLGDLQGANKALDDCLELDPGNTHALANKAIVLHSLQAPDSLEALVDFDQFIQPISIDSPSGFSGLTEFNAAMACFACDHPSLKQDRDSKATRKGSQTDALFPPTCRETRAFEQVIRKAVDNYIARLKSASGHPFLARCPRRYRISCWATVLGSGGHQAPHVHPTGWLSGVYYARLPEVIGSADQAGWIEFGRPDPKFYETSDFAVRLLQPVEGLMVLFPSYFWHRTIPFESQEQRVSFAFDIVAER